MSCISCFDEATIKYFSNNIKIEDGNCMRAPQVALAIPSRQGLNLTLNNENTPVLPIIVVTRDSIGFVNESPIVKKRIIRPSILSLNVNTKMYDGIDIMPCAYNYQINYFALYQEMFNLMTEQLLYNLVKKQCIKTVININNHTITSNALIKNVTIGDSTTYNQIADETSRMFHGNFSFSLYGFILNAEYATSSVLDTSINMVIKNSENKTTDIMYDINKIINQ